MFLAGMKGILLRSSSYAGHGGWDEPRNRKRHITKNPFAHPPVASQPGATRIIPMGNVPDSPRLAPGGRQRRPTGGCQQAGCLLSGGWFKQARCLLSGSGSSRQDACFPGGGPSQDGGSSKCPATTPGTEISSSRESHLRANPFTSTLTASRSSLDASRKRLNRLAGNANCL